MSRSSPFKIGLNPYGLAFTVGLQAVGTAPANTNPIGLEGFISIVRQLGLAAIELDHRWLTPLSDERLAQLGERLADRTRVCSFWLSQQPGETLDEAIRCTRGVGAHVLRFHLTPVVEGARASHGRKWEQMVEHARATLRRESPKVRDAGLLLAVEDHQDFGSEELVGLAEELGDHVGLTLDMGNPFAVGEDPVAFTRRAAHRIRHVHLKDYIAQFTDEGYRLVRCAVGDGCVPFAEMMDLLAGRHPAFTASIEIGALEARHVRLFTEDWWNGYGARDASEIGVMLGRLRRNRLPDDADYRTPWETGAPAEIIAAYEHAQVQKSVDNVRAWGWL